MAVLEPSTTEEIEAICRRFAEGEGLRTVYVESLRSPSLKIAIRADEPVPAASVIKVPIAKAWLAQEEAAGRLHTPCVEASSLWETDDPSVLSVFSPATRLTPYELAGFSLVTSDNDAANYMMSHTRASAITDVLTAAGCASTELENDFRDDGFELLTSTNLTTARDTAAIFKLLYSENSSLLPLLTNNLRNQRIPLLLDPSLRVAHKTGSLLTVCNDAGIVYGENEDLLLVFLTAQLSNTAECGFEIAKASKRICNLAGVDSTNTPAY